VGLRPGDGSPLVLLRVLGTGSAGRDIVGGALEGREGLGRAVDIVAVGKMDRQAAGWPCR